MNLRVILLFCLFLTTIVSFAQTTEDPNEGPDIARKRAEWFAHQRGVEPGGLPSLQRSQAIQQLEQMRSAEPMSLAITANTAAASLTTTPWRAIGPAPLAGGFNHEFTFSGRVPALAVDPRNSLVVYAGAADGGVWKTTNGGQSWTPLTDSQPSLSTGSIALDPANPDTVYVGTGELIGGDAYPGAGILKSTDGGTTWTSVSAPFMRNQVGLAIGAVAVSPKNSQIVLAAASNQFVNNGPGGILRSTDGGLTWSSVLPTSWGASAVVFDPNGIAYASLTVVGTTGAFRLQLWKSSDGGATWNQTGFTETDGSRMKLAIAPTDFTLYVAYALNQSTAVLLSSHDGGATFTTLNSANLCGSQCGYNLALAVNPVNSKELFFGGFQVWHSLDGGSTWTAASVNHVDQHDVAFSQTADHVYAGNDGGVWLATDHASGAVAFSSINTNLATLQFYPGISIAPGNPSFGLGGMQDNATARYRGISMWDLLSSGDGFSTAIDPNVRTTFYVSFQGGAIFKTTNDGGSFAGGTGLPTAGSFNTIFTMDRLNPSRLYTIRNSVIYQTTDGATTWHAISGQMNVRNAIQVAPSDANTVWAAGDSGAIAVSRNAGLGMGATWKTSQGPIKRNVSAIAIAPTDPTTAYVAISGFAKQFVGLDQVPGHVFKVTGTGTTWTNITGNLPDVPVNAIVVDPAIANSLYIGTDIGVFATTDGGITWNTMVTNLPRSVVVDLALDAPTRTLRAATHGRGMFDLTLPAAAAPAPTCKPSASAATPSVTICSPLNGSTLSSPVHVTAATKSATKVVAMKIYNNGVQAFSTTASTIDTKLTLAKGTHTLTVQAWNSGKQVFKKSVTITVK